LVMGNRLFVAGGMRDVGIPKAEWVMSDET